MLADGRRFAPAGSSGSADGTSSTDQDLDDYVPDAFPWPIYSRISPGGRQPARADARIFNDNDRAGHQVGRNLRQIREEQGDE